MNASIAATRSDRSACGRLRIGTSGFAYDAWRGDFYPSDLPRSQWFAHYARHFDAVEINKTFYSLPDDDTVDRWRDEAPPGFRFALKISRYLTHMKRLREPQEPTERFFAVAERLGAYLGPVLVQLPPNWHADPDRLDAFLDQAPGRHDYAVEVRDRDWFCAEIYDVLRAHGAAMVIAPGLDGGRLVRHPAPRTADWAYLRYHGDDYRGSYSSQALSGQARRISRWLAAGDDVWAFFDNTDGGEAPGDADDLRRFVARRRARAA